MMCQHCEIRKAVRPRILCERCYYIPSVRRKYPPKIKADTETMEELEAKIAARYPTMPRR